MGLPQPLVGLIAELGKLPGIGPRSAERLSLYLVQTPKNDVTRLAQAILDAREKILSCSICGALTETQPCSICGDLRRDGSLICVVERAVDIINIEKSGTYGGRYHVLGGKISPINGIGPEDLRFAELEHRIEHDESIREIIIALGADVEGDATSHYLAKRLGGSRVKISRLASGLPVGGSLEFADELTLGRAIQGRQPLS